jgi:hypothetical protein
MGTLHVEGQAGEAGLGLVVACLEEEKDKGLCGGLEWNTCTSSKARMSGPKVV